MAGSICTRRPYRVLRRLGAFILIIIILSPSEARNGISSKFVTVIQVQFHTFSCHVMAEVRIDE